MWRGIPYAAGDIEGKFVATELSTKAHRVQVVPMAFGGVFAYSGFHALCAIRSAICDMQCCFRGNNLDSVSVRLEGGEQ